MVDSCERGNEHWACINCGDFLTSLGTVFPENRRIAHVSSHLCEIWYKRLARDSVEDL
jgi:hypothetical protein